MKHRYSFITSFFILITVCTMVILGLFKNVQENATYDEFALGDQTVEAISYLMLEKAAELDPNYEMIQFDESNGAISDEQKASVNSSLRSMFSQYTTLLDNDENFGYEIHYKDQTISHNMPEKLDKSQALYYNEIYFDNESVQASQNSSYYYYDFLNEDDLYYVYEQANVVLNGNAYNQVYINLPKNISFTFYIPKDLESNQKIIVNSLNIPDAFAQFLIFALIIVALIILVFVLIFPIEIETKAQPFCSAVRMKLEIAVIFYTSALTLLLAGSIYLSGKTMNGTILRWLEQYKIFQPQLICYLLNFIVYIITFTTIACVYVYIKNMIKKKPLHFLKTNSLTGIFISYIKLFLDKTTSFDLANDLNKKLLIFVGINTLACIILCLFGPFGILLAIGYGLLCFFYLKKQLNKVQEDYLSTLEHAMSLAKGDFEITQNQDAGIFNSLEYELSSIQVGFETSLKEKIKSQNLKTELITNVSHDLKTPLTGIKNYLELLNDPGLDSKTRNEYLTTLTNYTDRLNNLIQDLFEISKANSGNIDLEPQKINLIEFMEQVHAENMSLLEEKNLILVFEHDDEDIYCTFDPDKTVRIFENLISNISKYTLENTRVFVTCKKEKNFATITYKNISKTFLNFDPEQITERFVRGDASRHESGSGLGLAIIKSFVEIQDGQFKIEIDGDVFKAILKLPLFK